MYLFLQNFRATLIRPLPYRWYCWGPLPSLPPLLLDKHANNVRDGARHRPIGGDAIVVVENVERVMAEEGLPQKKLPVSRWGRFRALWSVSRGTVGGIRTDGLLWRFYRCYFRQFSITIVSAMALSVLVALT